MPIRYLLTLKNVHQLQSLSSLLHDEAKLMKLCNSNQTPSPSLPVNSNSQAKGWEKKYWRGEKKKQNYMLLFKKLLNAEEIAKKDTRKENIIITTLSEPSL